MKLWGLGVKDTAMKFQTAKKRNSQKRFVKKINQLIENYKNIFVKEIEDRSICYY